MSITRETPGVYIEEVTGPGVIQGVSTGVAAFVGPTARGTSTSAVRVTSFDQFLERFAGPGRPHLYDSTEEPFYLSFALQGFFRNGGRRAHIARVTNGAAAWTELRNTAGGVEAIVRARQEGSAGNGIRVGVRPSTRTWTLATPTATVVEQAPASPATGFSKADPRVLRLDVATAGFAAGDAVRLVLPPAAPVVDNPGDQASVLDGSPVDLRVDATAASGGAPTVTAAGLPAGLAVDPTGLISGTPTTSGTSAVTVTATDAGVSTTARFTWVVTRPAPDVTSPGAQSSAVGTAIAPVQISARSRSGTPAQLTYAATGLPAPLQIAPNTGIVTGTPAAAGLSDVSVTVTEGTASSTVRFAWQVGPPASPAVDNPGDQRTALGARVSLQVPATPVTAGAALGYAAQGLPAGLAIDAATGLITGSATTAGPPAAVTVTVTEAGGGASQVAFDWTVTAPVPVVADPGRQTNGIGDTVTLPIVARSPSGAALAFAATRLPAGLGIDPATGVISGTVTTVGVTDAEVTLTAAGATSTVRFAWVVPAPVPAVVQRAEDEWIRVTGPDGTDPSDPAWPGTVQGAVVGLDDYAPGQARIRLDPPAAEAELPTVGTWIEAGSGPDAQTFQVTRVAPATGILTIARRTPAETLSLRRHRDLTSLSFDLVITPPSGPATTVPELSLDPISERFLLGEGVVPTDVVVLEEPPVPLFELRRMAAGDLPLGGGATADLDRLSGDDYRRALDLLERVDEVSIVCVPDAARYYGGDRIVRRAIQGAQLNHCLRMADRIAVFDPPRIPRGESPPAADEIDNVVQDLRSERGFGALYYPWLSVEDPRSTRGRPMTMLVPPSGHVAGVMARTDATKGVFKAPANETVDEVLGLERQLTDAEQGPLNTAGVNVLRILPGSNRVTVWGARTTVDPFVTDWIYVNVRRLMLMIEESIQEAIRWAVFEPNEPGLWKSLRRVISAFLREQWRAGALFGAEESEAFQVRIDEGLNPPSTRNKGYLYIEIKVAPVRPAEFVVVRIGMFDGGTDVEEG